jgi:hypothetical protein
MGKAKKQGKGEGKGQRGSGAAAGGAARRRRAGDVEVEGERRGGRTEDRVEVCLDGKRAFVLKSRRLYEEIYRPGA